MLRVTDGYDSAVFEILLRDAHGEREDITRDFFEERGLIKSEDESIDYVHVADLDECIDLAEDWEDEGEDSLERWVDIDVLPKFEGAVVDFDVDSSLGHGADAIMSVKDIRCSVEVPDELFGPDGELTKAAEEYGYDALRKAVEYAVYYKTGLHPSMKFWGEGREMGETAHVDIPVAILSNEIDCIR